MIKKELTYLSPQEIKDAIKRFVACNIQAAKDGKHSLAVCFEGEAGIGKTSVAMQVAKEENLGFHSLVLSQIEDIGDLVGFPFKAYEMEKDGAKEWFNDHMCQLKATMGWHFTSKVKTQYAEPEWVHKIKEHAYAILLIDDFTRADMRFQQAIMQLIQMGSYYGWSLPAGCTIVLTSNPNDEDYIVTTQDGAMQDRYCKFGAKFDIGDWTFWATKNNVDSRCINVMIRNYDVMMYAKEPNKMATHKMDVSPRAWSNFFQFAGSLKSFTDKESLEVLSRYGQGFVGDKMNIFITAINKNMDVLPEPKDIMEMSNEKLDKTLADLCGTMKGKGSSEFKAEVASAIILRLQYYLLSYAQNNPIDKKIIDKLMHLFDSQSLSEDLKMQLGVVLYSQEPSKKFHAISVHPKFRTKVMET